MKKYQRNLFLGILVVLSAFIGIFLEHTEKQSYVLNVKTDADAPIIPVSSEITDASFDKATDMPEAPDTKVNINTASKEELMTLDGIGEKRAEYIIEYRKTHGKFEVIEDIMKISGIGRKMFDGFKDCITVE